MAKPVEHCKHCGQLIQVYKRNIRPNMIRCLVKLHERFGYLEAKEVDIEPVKLEISDFSKLAYWGLIERGETKCHWKITRLGLNFLQGTVSLPKYKWVYDGKVQADPPHERNPETYIYDIVPDYISKETALSNSKSLPQYQESRQPELF